MKIKEILDFLQAARIPFSFTGDPEREVDRFSSLSQYREGTFTWIKKQENIPVGMDLTGLALVFVAEDVDAGGAPNVIRTPESKHAFFSSIEHFFAQPEERSAVGQFTYIGPRVKLGRNVRIGHNCTLDGDITIGDGTVIWNNVVIINRVTIGRNCEIQSGTVIGHDGYGYTEDTRHHKTMVKHFGGVIIEDDVLLGMNNVIARGVIDDTVIGRGTKMADLCHIGHNNRVGEDVAFISGCVVNGSCKIRDHAYIATSVLRNQCTIGEDAFVGLGAVVVKDVAPGQTVVGNPAKPFIKKKA